MASQTWKSPDSVYRPLSLERQEIRLVKLLPSEKYGDPLVCALETVDLVSIPQFQSLSYAWGLGKADVPLKVGDGVLRITTNLANALRAVRQTSDTILIWVDALCINQQDLSERNHQVQLMRQIFTSAVTVNIWLGLPFPGAQDALQLLGKLAEGMPLRGITLQSRSNTTSIVENMTAIFKYPWWQRLWVRTLQGSILNPRSH